jgi:hypothetical protein
MVEGAIGSPLGAAGGRVDAFGDRSEGATL